MKLLTGEVRQVASCAQAGVAGSAQAKASADDVSSAARKRRVAPKQSFAVRNTPPNLAVVSLVRPDSSHRLGVVS